MAKGGVATVKTFSGQRDEVWPSSLYECEVQIVEARHRYEPLLARAHTLSLLGISEALEAELSLRKPGIKAAGVGTDLQPRRGGTIGNRS